MRWVHPYDPDVYVENAEHLGACRTNTHPRWTEMELIGTDEAYVLLIVGRSTVPGETDRPVLKWLAEAWLLVRALLSPPANGKNSTVDVARAMLERASENDQDIADALARWRP
jgi:hypothetical protein